MIGLTEIITALDEAEGSLAVARANCEGVEAEHRDVSDRLNVVRPRPSMSEFADAATWREAVDARRFDRGVLLAKRRELESKQAIAAAAVIEAETRRNLLRATVELGQAAKAIECGEGGWRQFECAWASYFALPAASRTGDADFLARVSSMRIRALGLAGHQRISDTQAT